MPIRRLFVLLLALAVPAGAHAGAAKAAPSKVAAARPEAVPFVADDYDRALAAARAKHVPIFVESWAPW